MDTRTFQAKEIKEALALVRRELGPQALILGTRRIPGPALGLLGGSMIEITASAPPAAASASQTPTSQSSGSAAKTSKPLLPLHRAQRNVRPAASQRPVRQTIAADPVTSVLAAAGSSPDAVHPHAALRRRLLSAFVPRELAERWLQRIDHTGNDATARADQEARLRGILHDELRPAAGILAARSRVAALVGPTGVGKTTTIAKLAAREALLHGRQVALISNDDHRVGAATYLRSYAEVLDVPFMVAANETSLARAIASLRNAELILIDTSGVSLSTPQEATVLAHRLSRAGEPVSVHLCMAAATRQAELDRIMHMYSGMNPHALIATKVDEALGIGSVIAAAIEAKLPFSFVTTGQGVPDDIEPGEVQRLVDLLLGGVRA